MCVCVCVRVQFIQNVNATDQKLQKITKKGDITYHESQRDAEYYHLGDQLRGVDSVGGLKLPSPIDKASRH